jgi:hypothetical protein
MADQSQKTKKSTDEQSISTSRRSVLSTVGAGVAALGVGVGSTGSVKAESGTAISIDPNAWNATYPNGSQADEPWYDGAVELEYDKSRGGLWEFTTTATKTEEISLRWTYAPNHRKWDAYWNRVNSNVEASISIDGDKTTLTEVEDHWGYESFGGSITRSIEKGDEIVVKAGDTTGPVSGGYNDVSGTVHLEPESLSSTTSSPRLVDHDAGSWSDSGPGSHDISSGDTYVEFTYDSDDYWWQTWEYEATAQSDGTVDVDWSYDGNHSWYRAKAEAYIEVNNAETKLVDKGTNGKFSASGKTRISVSEGDTVRVTLRGHHYDWSKHMSGTFNATFSEV